MSTVSSHDETKKLGNLGIIDDSSSARKLRSSDSCVLVTARSKKTGTHQDMIRVKEEKTKQPRPLLKSLQAVM